MYGTNNFGYNPYGYIPQRPIPPIEQTQTIQQIQPRQILNGKQVESIDVVKAMDIPLDGSISYFPIADGSAIVSKQLQMDGTSKIVVFKPIEEPKEEIKYITKDDMEKAINGIDLSELEDIKDDIKELRQDIKDLRKKKKDE